MKTVQKSNQKTDRIGQRWFVILASCIIFPMAILLPFLLRSHENLTSVSSRLLGWGARGAIQSTPAVSIGWVTPSGIHMAGIAGILALLVLGGCVLWSIGKTTHRSAKRNMKIHFIVAIVMIVVVGSAYAIMRAHSQAVEQPIASGQAYALTEHGKQICQMVTIDGQASSVVSASCQQAKIIKQPTFGYGIAPVYVVLESAIFLITPLLNWYRYTLSPSRVAGQKKDELFQ